MKIASFDIGSVTAVVDNIGGQRRVAARWELTGTRHVKLAALQLHLEHYFSSLPEALDVAFYERPFARGLAATRSGWAIAGLIEAMATNYQCAILDEKPSTLKLFATGRGHAEKDEMILFAQMDGYPGDNEHEADAWLGHKYAMEKAVRGE
jgi:hypothetical protein